MSEQNQKSPVGSQNVVLQQGPAPLYPLIVDMIDPNSEEWIHNNHHDTGVETVLNAAAAVNFGAVVAAGLVRRVREITVRNLSQAATVITLSVGGVNRLSFDVPGNTTRTWSSEDGRAFTAGQQPLIASSAAGAGTETFVTASGVEAAQS